jgi:hypothetical protein
MAHSRKLLIIVICFVLTFSLTFQPLQAQISSLPVLVLAIRGELPVYRYPDQVGSSLMEQPLTVGTMLDKSDYLEIPTGSEVLIVCDGVYQPIAQSSVPDCQNAVEAATSIFLWGEITIIGGFRPGIEPDIILPGNSLVANAPSQIEWVYHNPEIDGAVNYAVEVRDSSNNSVVWETPRDTPISSTNIALPLNTLNFQPFAAGQPRLRYVIKVTASGIANGENANGTPSPITGNSSATFCYADNQVLQRIDQALHPAGSLLPTWASSDAFDYAHAHLAYQEKLYSDALLLLHKMLPVPLDEPIALGFASATQISHSPSFYILLGDIYQAMELRSRAVMAYQRAEAVAAELKDQLTLAAVKVRMGDTLKGFQSSAPPDAKQYYDDAEKIYRDIGYVEKADTVKARSQEYFSPNDFPHICD